MHCCFWVIIEASITWNERCLIANPETPSYQRAWRYSQIACAHARNGDIRAARTALAEAVRLAPHDTVRSHYPEVLEPTYMAQIEDFREGLRAAGLRDHAEEDADFGVEPDNELRLDLRGLTPTKAPGAQDYPNSGPAYLACAMRTESSWIQPLIRRGHRSPVPSDWKSRVEAEAFSDTTQDRLRRKMAQLTNDNSLTPIVVVGWNSEHFDGWNLALRIAALGYSNICWYRGGREAWEANGLPETNLELAHW